MENMFFRFSLMVTQKRWFQEVHKLEKLFNTTSLLNSPIRDSFAGVSQHVIQEWINSNRKHCESHPIFENKYPLQPIIAKSAIDVCQIDLVIMEERPSKWYDNKTYFYILNVMDLFSRYISLKPL